MTSELNSSNEFDDLFSFDTKEDEIEHKAHMIMFKFLSELETINDGKLSRKEIAKLLETSGSYITQLFRGDKLINLLMLAKIELAFDIEFEIGAKINSEKKTEITTKYAPHILYINSSSGDGYSPISSGEPTKTLVNTPLSYKVFQRTI